MRRYYHISSRKSKMKTLTTPRIYEEMEHQNPYVLLVRFKNMYNYFIKYFGNILNLDTIKPCESVFPHSHLSLGNFMFCVCIKISMKKY